jgi:hypothetical protein
MSKVSSDETDAANLTHKKENMDSISIRYGEDVTLPLDAGDTTAISADIYIGKPGQVYILTKHITLTDGKGTFVFSGAETEIPLDTYYYQINVTDELGAVEKYPSPQSDCDSCDSEFPKFIVHEALDQIEVS